MKVLIRLFTTLLLATLLLCQAGCGSSSKIERYTYVRPTWLHGKGLKQCVAYFNTKPVKREYYFRIQQFLKEF